MPGDERFARERIVANRQQLAVAAEEHLLMRDAARAGARCESARRLAARPRSMRARRLARRSRRLVFLRRVMQLDDLDVGEKRAASSAKRIISTAPIEKFGTSSAPTPRFAQSAPSAARCSSRPPARTDHRAARPARRAAARSRSSTGSVVRSSSDVGLCASSSVVERIVDVVARGPRDARQTASSTQAVGVRARRARRSPCVPTRPRPQPTGSQRQPTAPIRFSRAART